MEEGLKMAINRAKRRILNSMPDDYIGLADISRSVGRCDFDVRRDLDDLGKDGMVEKTVIDGRVRYHKTPGIYTSPLGIKGERVVYFVKSETAGLIKIGITDDLENRFYALQMGSPVKLELLASVPGYANEESGLHTRFQELRHHGEWFEATSELEAYIMSIKEKAIQKE